MTSSLTQFLAAEITQTLSHCRRSTLELFSNLDPQLLSQQPHPDFSPIGWHLGHIAFTEAYWILEYLGGKEPLFPQYQQLFAADGLPKSQRQFLPSLEEIYNYLNIVRTAVLAYLETAPLPEQERLWRWLIQHESQHSETISFLLKLLQGNHLETPLSESLITPRDSMVTIAAGEFLMGSNKIIAQDNERPAHLVYLDTYQIDRYPVTCGQYRQFLEAGGYQQSQWWSPQGWQWLQQANITQPLYWQDSPLWSNHPVCGVSYYEAEAYACFLGKRLPSEAEWEKAASWDPEQNSQRLYPWGDDFPSPNHGNYNLEFDQTTPVTAYPQGQSAYGCYDLLGNVWEWTASWFEGYPGFESYPYPGYSQVYFDRCHRVLRGGSWATRPWAFRASFRNWYQPEVRQILAGFRCAL